LVIVNGVPVRASVAQALTSLFTSSFWEKLKVKVDNERALEDAPVLYERILPLDEPRCELIAIIHLSSPGS
jgi:hypothetical protein